MSVSKCLVCVSACLYVCLSVCLSPSLPLSLILPPPPPPPPPPHIFFLLFFCSLSSSCARLLICLLYSPRNVLRELGELCHTRSNEPKQSGSVGRLPATYRAHGGATVACVDPVTRSNVLGKAKFQSSPRNMKRRGRRRG